MSAAERDAGHCPHCGGELPEPDLGEGAAGISFCPTCGRRVEGWRTGFRATIGGANAPATHPDGEQPTRAVAPSAALLRAAVAAEVAREDAKATRGSSAAGSPAASRSEPPDDDEPVRPRSSPFVPFAMIGGAAFIAIGALFILGRPHRPPSAVVRPAPTVVPAAPPVIAPTPDVTTPSAPAAPARPAKAAAVAKAPAPVVAAPAKAAAPARPTSATKDPAGKPPKVASGGLPHKAGRTDSAPTSATAQPSGTGAPMVPPPSATSAPPPAAPSGTEQAPQTPQQLEQARHDEGATQMDAQNVRFVVQSHLPQVQACYSRAFKDAAPGGRVDIGFVIGGNGRASKVRTEQNQTKSTVLSTCLEHLIADWQFVRPASGQLELIYPFVFSPGT